MNTQNASIWLLTAAAPSDSVLCIVFKAYYILTMRIGLAGRSKQGLAGRCAGLRDTATKMVACGVWRYWAWRYWAQTQVPVLSVGYSKPISEMPAQGVWSYWSWVPVIG